MDDSHARFRLAVLPTPLHRLDRLSEHYGTDLWIKRDDLTGFGMGGNKVRKAEYLIADALASGATDVITAGAIQSNHARVVAAAARAAGLECHLVLSGPPPTEPRGNILLDHLSHANLHIVSTSAERGPATLTLADELSQQGRTPYVIPIGGSNGIGAQGYIDGFRELAAQLATLPRKPTIVVFATSSGGTYGGLLAGKTQLNSDIELLGIRVDLDPGAEEDVARIAVEAAGLSGSTLHVSAADVRMNSEFVGEGYGLPTEAGMSAIGTVWRTEGILLDPVYTGKAMSGLMALAGRGSLIGSRAVFLHTGGEPSVFAATGLV
jgi:L-cysteate sulfo-lyase